MKKIFLAMAIALMTSLTAFAQETYTWNKANVQLTVFNGMKVLQNDDEMFMVGNDNARIEIHAINQNLNDLSEDEVAGILISIADNLNIDLSQIGKDVFECVNGDGIFIIAPHKTDANTLGLIAFAGSKTSDNRVVCVAGLLTADQAENVGMILGGINFLK